MQGCAFNETAICFIKKLSEKQASPPCRSLFGNSDPSETRRMLNTTLARETKRLLEEWNFDARWVSGAGKREPGAGGEISKSPRYQWQKLDGTQVSQFYVRVPRKHHSELRVAHDAKKQRLNPLQTVDQNTSHCAAAGHSVEPSKQLSMALKFGSPPHITGSANKDVVRVTARHAPLPSFEQSSTVSDEQPVARASCSISTSTDRNALRLPMHSSLTPPSATASDCPESLAPNSCSASDELTCIAPKVSKRQLFNSNSAEIPKKRPRLSANSNSATARRVQQKITGKCDYSDCRVFHP